MENLEKDNQKIDYNSIPVLYCSHCLSLKIMDIPDMEGTDYCDVCGSTDVQECQIEEWRELYKQKYGQEY